MTNDLAALCSRLTRRLVEAERPLLEEAGLTMWEYAVLSQLRRADAPTQQVLAAQVRYDKTRLIGLLDGLERRGLVSRAPDPADRRARIVRLTERGRDCQAGAQRAIREMEVRELGAGDADELRALLTRLTST